MNHWVARLIGETQAKILGLLRRAPQPIASLAGALGVTDNAVRTHIADLRREGFVADVGARRDTGGKPARLYGLTKEGEELFPKAYALVLGELVREIAETQGRDRVAALLDRVGRRLAAEQTASGPTPARVVAAAAALRQLGADLDVQRVAGGWRLQGHGCPLSAVTASHPDVCALAQTIIRTITERPVEECCDRSNPERPRCAFMIAAAAH